MRELEIGWCFLQRSFAAVLLVLPCKGKTLRCSFPGGAFRTKPPQKESRSSRLLAQPLDPGSGWLFPAGALQICPFSSSAVACGFHILCVTSRELFPKGLHPRTSSHQCHQVFSAMASGRV